MLRKNPLFPENADINKTVLISQWHKPQGRVWAKIISILVSITFVFPCLTWAFEPGSFSAPAQHISYNQQPIKISPKFGIITQLYKGNERLVVHVQDLHCNYEVQNNIAKMIDTLAGSCGLQLVGIEGASLPINVTKLSTFPVEEVKRETAHYLMKQGKLTGPELYAAVGQHPIQLEGIETAALYEHNHKTVMQFLNNESQGYIFDLRETLEELKPGIYNPTLAALDKKKQAFRRGALSLLKYCAYLHAYANRCGEDLGAYPNFKVYLSERRPAFSKGLDSDLLFSELGQLDKRLRARVYTTSVQAEMDLMQHRLDVMEKLLNISAAPGELAEYRYQPGDFKVGRFREFIRQYDKTGELILDPEVYALDRYLEEARTFYQTADERSRVFVGNMLDRMEVHRTGISMLVTGGFHTPLVLKELEHQGVSYICVKPQLRRRDIINPYFALLRNQRTPLEKLLAQNQNVLAIELSSPQRRGDTNRVIKPAELTITEGLYYRLADTILKTGLLARELKKFTAASGLLAAYQEKIRKYAANDPGILLQRVKIKGKTMAAGFNTGLSAIIHKGRKFDLISEAAARFDMFGNKVQIIAADQETRVLKNLEQSGRKITAQQNIIKVAALSGSPVAALVLIGCVLVRSPGRALAQMRGFASRLDSWLGQAVLYSARLLASVWFVLLTHSQTKIPARAKSFGNLGVLGALIIIGAILPFDAKADGAKKIKKELHHILLDLGNDTAAIEQFIKDLSGFQELADKGLILLNMEPAEKELIFYNLAWDIFKGISNLEEKQSGTLLENGYATYGFKEDTEGLKLMNLLLTAAEKCNIQPSMAWIVGEVKNETYMILNIIDYPAEIVSVLKELHNDPETINNFIKELKQDNLRKQVGKLIQRNNGSLPIERLDLIIMKLTLLFYKLQIESKQDEIFEEMQKLAANNNGMPEKSLVGILELINHIAAEQGIKPELIILKDQHKEGIGLLIKHVNQRDLEEVLKKWKNTNNEIAKFIQVLNNPLTRVKAMEMLEAVNAVGFDRDAMPDLMDMANTFYSKISGEKLSLHEVIEGWEIELPLAETLLLKVIIPLARDNGIKPRVVQGGEKEAGEYFVSFGTDDLEDSLLTRNLITAYDDGTMEREGFDLAGGLKQVLLDLGNSEEKSDEFIEGFESGIKNEKSCLWNEDEIALMRFVLFFYKQIKSRKNIPLDAATIQKKFVEDDKIKSDADEVRELIERTINYISVPLVKQGMEYANAAVDAEFLIKLLRSEINEVRTRNGGLKKINTDSLAQKIADEFTSAVLGREEGARAGIGFKVSDIKTKYNLEMRVILELLPLVEILNNQIGLNNEIEIKSDEKEIWLYIDYKIKTGRQPLDLPGAAGAWAVSFGALAITLAHPLLMVPAIGFFLFNTYKVLWTFGAWRKMPNRGWFTPVAEYDPATGGIMVTHGELKIRTNWLVRAHEQYAHAWAHKLADRIMPVLGFKSVAEYAQDAYRGNKTWGYYIWNVIFCGFLSHILDSLAAVITLAQAPLLSPRIGAVFRAIVGPDNNQGLILISALTFLPALLGVIGLLPISLALPAAVFALFLLAPFWIYRSYLLNYHKYNQRINDINEELKQAAEQDDEKKITSLANEFTNALQEKAAQQDAMLQKLGVFIPITAEKDQGIFFQPWSELVKKINILLENEITPRPAILKLETRDIKNLMGYIKKSIGRFQQAEGKLSIEQIFVREQEDKPSNIITINLTAGDTQAEYKWKIESESRRKVRMLGEAGIYGSEHILEQNIEDLEWALTILKYIENGMKNQVLEAEMAGDLLWEYFMQGSKKMELPTRDQELSYLISLKPALRPLLEETLAEAQINLIEQKILVLLEPDQEMSAAEIAEALNLEQSEIEIILPGLVFPGWKEKGPAKLSRRLRESGDGQEEWIYKLSVPDSRVRAVLRRITWGYKKCLAILGLILVTAVWKGPGRWQEKDDIDEIKKAYAISRNAIAIHEWLKKQKKQEWTLREISSEMQDITEEAARPALYVLKERTEYNAIDPGIEVGIVKGGFVFNVLEPNQDFEPFRLPEGVLDNQKIKEFNTKVEILIQALEADNKIEEAVEEFINAFEQYLKILAVPTGEDRKDTKAYAGYLLRHPQGRVIKTILSEKDKRYYEAFMKLAGRVRSAETISRTPKRRLRPPDKAASFNLLMLCPSAPRIKELIKTKLGFGFNEPILRPTPWLLKLFPQSHRIWMLIMTTGLVVLAGNPQVENKPEESIVQSDPGLADLAMRCFFKESALWSPYVSRTNMSNVYMAEVSLKELGWQNWLKAWILGHYKENVDTGQIRIYLPPYIQSVLRNGKPAGHNRLAHIKYALAYSLAKSMLNYQGDQRFRRELDGLKLEWPDKIVERELKADVIPADSLPKAMPYDEYLQKTNGKIVVTAAQISGFYTNTMQAIAGKKSSPGREEIKRQLEIWISQHGEPSLEALLAILARANSGQDTELMVLQSLAQEAGQEKNPEIKDLVLKDVQAGIIKLLSDNRAGTFSRQKQLMPNLKIQVMGISQAAKKNMLKDIQRRLSDYEWKKSHTKEQADNLVMDLQALEILLQEAPDSIAALSRERALEDEMDISRIAGRDKKLGLVVATLGNEGQEEVNAVIAGVEMFEIADNVFVPKPVVTEVNTPDYHADISSSIASGIMPEDSLVYTCKTARALPPEISNRKSLWLTRLMLSLARSRLLPGSWRLGLLDKALRWNPVQYAQSLVEIAERLEDNLLVLEFKNQDLNRNTPMGHAFRRMVENPSPRNRAKFVAVFIRRNCQEHKRYSDMDKKIMDWLAFSAIMERMGWPTMKFARPQLYHPTWQIDKLWKIKSKELRMPMTMLNAIGFKALLGMAMDDVENCLFAVEQEAIRILHRKGLRKTFGGAA